MSTQTKEHIGAEGGIRILAVIPGDGSGASMIFARRQMSAIANIPGFTVRVFFLPSRTSPIAVAFGWWKLLRERREFRPHIVHAHYGTATSFITACTGRGALVITFRGSDLNGDAGGSKLRSLVGQCLSQLSTLRSRCVICVSGQLRDRLWWVRNKALLLPSGVDLQLFRPMPREQARLQVGWPLGERVVIFHGGQNPRAKGYDLVRSALTHARNQIGPIRLQVLDGTTAPDLMPLYLSAADCLALASPREGSPNVVKEALACNLPVVSVPVGDVPERLAGVLLCAIVPYDPVEFGNALARVLSTRLRSNGRRYIVECSANVVASRLAVLYREIAQDVTQRRTTPEARTSVA